MIWVPDIFFTQDGPVHLYIAHLLNDLNNPAAPASHYFEANWRIVPNLFTYGLGQALLLITSPAITEKLIVSLYALSLPCAVYYCARQFRALPLTAALLSLALISSSALHLGFYNYSFSLVFLTLGLGYWWRIESSETQRVGIGQLFLLGGISHVAFACHAIGFAFLLLLCAIGSLALRAQTYRTESLARAWLLFWRKTLPIGLSLLPGFILLLIFFQSESQHADLLSSIEDALWRDRRADQMTYFDLLWERGLFLLKGAHIKSAPILLYVACLTLFLLTYHQLRDKQSTDAAEGFHSTLLALLLLAVLSLYLALPLTLMNTRFMEQRLLPVAHLMLLLWLCKNLHRQGMSPGKRLIGTGIAILILVNLLIPLERLNRQLQSNEAYAEYRFAEDYLSPGQTFLTFNLRHHEQADPYDFFLHEGKRLAIRTGAIDLKVIQARSPNPTVPIIYAANVSPFLHMIGQPLSPLFLEYVDPAIYEDATGEKPDFLLFWGEPAHKMQTSYKEYFKRLAPQYRLIATSPGRGRMVIFQRKENETGNSSFRRKAISHEQESPIDQPSTLQ